MSFFLVYIQEAHPTDLWQTQSNLRDGVLLVSPRSDEERAVAASSCIRGIGIHIPAVLDKIENATERSYTAWPDRMYLIDTMGRVAFKSAPGPFGFSTRQLELALEKLTGASH